MSEKAAERARNDRVGAGLGDQVRVPSPDVREEMERLWEVAKAREKD